MNLKNYKTIKETEKAVEIQFSYWTPTNDDKKKHHVKKVEVWIPKSCINDGVIDYQFLNSKLLQSPKLRKSLRWSENFGEIPPSKKPYINEYFNTEKRNNFLKRLAKYISFKTGKKYVYHSIDSFYRDADREDIFYKKSEKSGIVKRTRYTDGTLYIFARPTLNNHNSKAVYIW